MSSERNRYVNLINLPRKEGIGGNKGKPTIDWINSIGLTVDFVYDDISGKVEIVDYIKEKQRIIIKYLDYPLYEIATCSFLKCSLGRLLKKHTKEFKIELGKEFKDNKRDLTIIDRAYRKSKDNANTKYYKYHCNKCGNEDWMTEGHICYEGCNICSNKKTKLGFNTIWDTDKWMVDLGVSEEDAKKHTSQSNQKITVKCPNCRKEKEIALNSIYRYKTIACNCSDNISYPEKFMTSLLNQLKIDYITQYSPQWVKPRKYDFYISKYALIIEMDGEFHYKYNHKSKQSKELSEKIDREKDKLAIKNNLKIIRIDCNYKNFDRGKYIKNSILNSELKNIFDLYKIDWQDCERFSLSNLVKDVCEYWKIHNNVNNENLKTTDLVKIFNLSQSTIIQYLKKGNELNWCFYDARNEMKKTWFTKKEIEIYLKNGKYVGCFLGVKEVQKICKEKLDIDISDKTISASIDKRACKNLIFVTHNKFSEKEKKELIKQIKKRKMEIKNV